MWWFVSLVSVHQCPSVPQRWSLSGGRAGSASPNALLPEPGPRTLEGPPSPQPWDVHGSSITAFSVEQPGGGEGGRDQRCCSGQDVTGSQQWGSRQRLLKPLCLGSWGWLCLVATLRRCDGAFLVTLGGAHGGEQCRSGEDRCREPASWSASSWFWGQQVPTTCGARQCPECPALRRGSSGSAYSQGVGGVSLPGKGSDGRLMSLVQGLRGAPSLWHPRVPVPGKASPNIQGMGEGGQVLCWKCFCLNP